MLNNLTIVQAHDKLVSQEISCQELTNACIDRIKKVDKKVHALLATDFDNALKQAKAVDKKISAGKKIGILEGIPCTIKDMLLTKGITTTASSNMLKNYVPLFDATVVEKLKEAGAIILAKNNCDAWAHGSSTENSDFGPTHNPWDLDRVPGGSSGGSAAAVAANECIFSIGTDTGGSIRQPASLCGVVGLKPTYGRVSRYGAIAMGSSLDTIGPFTKTVEDSAIILNIIAGKDKSDSTTLPKEVPDYTKALKKDIRGMKIALPKECFGSGLKDDVKKTILAAADKFTEMGAEVEEVSLKYLEYGIATYYVIMPSEVSSNLGRYDGIRYGYCDDKAENLFEVYTKSRANGFGAEAKRRIMIGTYVLSAGYYDAYYKKAMKVRTLIKQEFENIFRNYDLIIMPTSPETAFKIGEKSNDPLAMYLADIYTVTLNMAGVPGITIPCGFDDKNLPIGMQIVAPQFGEEKMLGLASVYEQATEWHKQKPKL